MLLFMHCTLLRQSVYRQHSTICKQCYTLRGKCHTNRLHLIRKLSDNGQIKVQSQTFWEQRKKLVKENDVSQFYPHKFTTTDSICNILENYTEQSCNNRCLSLAGRLVSINHCNNGEVILDLQSEGSHIQISTIKDRLESEQYGVVGLNVGDIIGVTGTHVWTSKISIQANKITRLVPCLKNLYNDNYINKLSNSYEIFKIRSHIVSSLHKFLHNEGFLEVETPVLNLTTEKLNKYPFVTYHHETNYPMFLKNSSLRFLKILQVGGLSRIYDISKQFQNTVLPETTTCEMCISNANYEDGMVLLEKFMQKVPNPFKRVQIVSTLESILDEPVNSDTLIDIGSRHGISSDSPNDILDILIQKYIICKNDEPIFLIDPPVVRNLTKQKDNTYEHFMLCMGGHRIATGSSVVTNPIDIKRALGKPTHNAILYGNEEFIHAMEFGMPPCCEIQFSIDKFVAVETRSKISDVMLFPRKEEVINTHCHDLPDNYCSEYSSIEDESSGSDEAKFRDNRIQSINKEHKEGLTLYNDKIESTISLEDFQLKYSYLKPTESCDNIISIDGRIHSVRDASRKLRFYDVIKDSTKLQVLANKKFYNGGDFNQICNFLRRGDLIHAEGIPIRTKAGELSLRASRISCLTPTLRIVPEVFTGFHSSEDRFRKRYLDLMMNDSSKNLFITRARVITYLRQFLEERGFVGVETPILNKIAGGATAKPFVTKYGSLDAYLRIAPELYLKKLIVSGFEKVYEIGKQFRNEGFDRTHNPEFTSCEFYMAYADYNDLMTLTEEFLSGLVYHIHGSYQLNYNNIQIDFTPPFERVNLTCELEGKLGVQLPNLDKEDSITYLKDLCDQHAIQYAYPLTCSRLLDKLVGHFLEDHCNNPTFIMNHPKVMSPLAKNHRQFPGLTERFELFVAGSELCNAYTELNDPFEQRKRFEAQGTESIDEDFLEALEFGLPPTAGWGMGIDRLCMMLTNCDSIRKVLLFPIMKPEPKMLKKKIEGT